MLHRVPWRPLVADIVAIVRGRGRPVIFETDDLVFAPELHDQIAYLDTLPADWTGVMFGNEVLDALPIELLARRGEKHFRRGVALEGRKVRCPDQEEIEWRRRAARVELAAGDALPAAAVRRPGGPAGASARSRRRDRGGQRHAVRPRFQRLDHRPRRGGSLRRRARGRSGVHQRHDHLVPGVAVRRRKALRLRTRALRSRHPRLLQPQDRLDRLTGGGGRTPPHPIGTRSRDQGVTGSARMRGWTTPPTA